MSLAGESGSASAVAVRLNSPDDVHALWEALESKGKSRSSLILRTNVFATHKDSYVVSETWDVMTINFKGADMRDMITRTCDELGLEWELSTVKFQICEYEPVTWKHIHGTPVEAA